MLLYDSADEDLFVQLKSKTGPAVVTSVVNDYYFYKFLTERYTVGEAHLPSIKTYRGELVLQDLLGDPSLKVLKVD